VKRIVLLLVVSSVAMFVLVLKTPPKLTSIGLWGENEAQQTSNKAVQTSTAKRQTANVQTPVKSGGERKTTPTRPSPAPTTTRGSDQQAKSEKAVPSAKGLTISGDSATLYAVNSPKGKVLTVLSKGTVVEPDLQLLDAAGNWTLVRVPDLNMAGFVQTSNLVRTSPLQSTAR
jgi:hypothetical protein